MAFKSTSSVWINRLTAVLFVGLVFSICLFIFRRKQVIRGVVMQKPEIPYKPYEGLNADEIYYKTTTFSFPWPAWSPKVSTPSTNETPSTAVTRKVTSVTSTRNLVQPKGQNYNNSVHQTIPKKVLNVSKNEENTLNKENKIPKITADDKSSNKKNTNFESSSQKVPIVQTSQQKMKNSGKETVNGTKLSPKTKETIKENKVKQELKSNQKPNKDSPALDKVNTPTKVLKTGQGGSPDKPVNIKPQKQALGQSDSTGNDASKRKMPEDQTSRVNAKSQILAAIK